MCEMGGSELHFWTKPREFFPKASEILYSGFLYCQDSLSFGFAPQFYVLTNTKLLQVMWWTEDRVQFLEGKMSWATVEPFEDKDDKQSRFGFRLKCGEWGDDFYVSDSGELDQWLLALAQVAIMTDLKNDYEMLGEIGRGGQSIVYMAVDKANGGKVAVKSYAKPTLLRSLKRKNSLRSEIDILRTISHTSLLRLHRVYESASSIDLVTDYYEGQVLSTALSTPFTETEALGFMVKLMDILQYLESEHIVHRDIKPANIVLTNPADRTQFQLLDFGLALRCEGTDLCDTSGSPGYFAPEILRKRKHGIKADIYAAGIIFYTLITGTNPFLSPSCSETLRRNCENDISFNSQIWQGISSPVISIIRVMTNLNPDQRMSARDLSTWLGHVCARKSHSKSDRRNSYGKSKQTLREVMGTATPHIFTLVKCELFTNIRRRSSFSCTQNAVK